MSSSRTEKMNQTIPNDLFAALMAAHGDAVYKFCRSLTYSKEDADDLFQETFLSAFARLPKISASNDPKGFLFSIALYLWKSWKRKYARRERIAPAAPLDETIPCDRGVEDVYMAQEEIRMVRELVDALPEKFKIPIVLYYTVELRVPEIANILKLPVGTVKSRLFKARKIIEKGLIAVGYEK